MRCGVKPSLASWTSTLCQGQNFDYGHPGLPFVCIYGLGERYKTNRVGVKKENSSKQNSEWWRCLSTLLMDEMATCNMPEDNQLSLFDDLL